MASPRIRPGATSFYYIYTNDLLDYIAQATTILFTDETTAYESASYLNYMYLYTCSSLNLIHLTDCFRGNQLSLNVTKTSYMLFSNATKYLPELQLHINDQLIVKTECATFLGIYIDDKLKWDVHINKIKSRISGSLYAIDKIKHFAPIKY